MARTRIAKFNIQVTASAEQVRQVFSRLREQATSTFGSMRNTLTDLSFSWNQITDAISPVVDKFRELTAELDVLAKTASRLEIAPEFLQTLEIAGQRIGLEFDQITDGLRDFQERVGQLRRGENSIVEAFQAIGIESSRLSTDLSVAFTQVVKALGAVEDQTVRSAIAAELFGEAGRLMLDLFANPEAIRSAAAELDKIGGAFTEEDLRRITEFNDAWGDLTRQFKVLAQTLTINVAPSLRATLAVLEQYWRPFRSLGAVLDQLGVSRGRVAAVSPIAGYYLSNRGQGTGTASATLSRIETSANDREQTRLLRSIDQKINPDALEVVPAGVQ